MPSVLASPLFWLYLPITVAIICFVIGVGEPTKFIDYFWLWFLFRNISPYVWAAFGVGLTVGLSILGAAW